MWGRLAARASGGSSTPLPGALRRASVPHNKHIPPLGSLQPTCPAPCVSILESDQSVPLLPAYGHLLIPLPNISGVAEPRQADIEHQALQQQAGESRAGRPAEEVPPRGHSEHVAQWEARLSSVGDEQQRCTQQGGGEVLAGRYKQRRCAPGRPRVMAQESCQDETGHRERRLQLESSGGTITVPTASTPSHASFLASLAVDCEGAGGGTPASRRFSSLVAAAYLWAKTSK